MGLWTSSLRTGAERDERSMGVEVLCGSSWSESLEVEISSEVVELVSVDRNVLQWRAEEDGDIVVISERRR